MLLDRKRINKWAKWVALGLAIVFGFSFVLMGVGSGTNLNWSDLWNSFGGAKESTVAQTSEERIAELKSILDKTPNDTTVLLALADEYQLLGEDLVATQYLEKAAALMKGDVDIRMRLANIYLTPETRDDQAAIRILNEVTSLDPTNAQAFLQLGAAQRGAGNNEAAILAWNRYLQLAPDGEMADTVRNELDVLMATTATTVPPVDGGDGSTTTTAE